MFRVNITNQFAQKLLQALVAQNKERSATFTHASVIFGNATYQLLEAIMWSSNLLI